MKAIILAAGKGSRISSISNNLPKSLLPFKDVTILGHSLNLLNDNNVREIVVVTGYKNKLIEKYVKKHWLGKVDFVFNELYENTNVLYSFSLSLPYIDDDDFIFLHADTVFENEILKKLINAPDSKKTILPVDKHPCGEEEMKVKTLGKNIIEINKTMDANLAFGEFIGLARVSCHQIGLIEEEIVNIFKKKNFQAFFELALENLIKSNLIEVELLDITSNKWSEIDFPEDYKHALELFK